MNRVPVMIRAASAALLAAAVLAGAASSSAFAAQRAPGYRGRLVFRIVSRVPGPRHAAVTASGAFQARGYYVRKHATIVFPHGRITVRRHIESRSEPPPNLRTCTFSIRESGTFAVTRATGRYRGLRDAGTFRTVLRGKLRKTGRDRCGKLAHRRTITYEVGHAR